MLRKVKIKTSGESQMKHLSISQQKEKTSWGADLVKGASTCTAARIGEARRARPAGVVKDRPTQVAGTRAKPRGLWCA